MELRHIESAEGPIAEPVLQAARLLVESVDFLRWVGAANAAEAAKHIHLVEHDVDPPQMRCDRPFAVIWPQHSPIWEQYADGAKPVHSGTGILRVFFTDKDRVPGDRTASWIKFANDVGQIVQKGIAECGISDRLRCSRIDHNEEGPFPSATKDSPIGAAYWYTTFTLHWYS